MKSAGDGRPEHGMRDYRAQRIQCRIGADVHRDPDRSEAYLPRLQACFLP
jgi:hypothetical protein